MTGLRNDDISLLGGLRTATRAALYRQGIYTVHQLAVLSVEELQRFNGLGKITAPQVKAHAQAFVEQRPVWCNALLASCFQGGFMFDLETDGFTHVPWCFGWTGEDGSTHTAVVASRTGYETLVDGSEIVLVPGSDALWELFNQWC
jgi:predicted RecB family nuclease